MHEVSLFRLYTLRICYLILAVGLGLLHLAVGYPAHPGVRCRVRHSMLFTRGLGLTAVLGLRYPVKMLPLLIFELVWKAVYLLAFAAPLGSAHQDVVPCDVAPGDERDEIDDHEAGLDIRGGGLCHLVSGP